MSNASDPSCPIPLYTDKWSSECPGLPAKYPHMPMQMAISLHDAMEFDSSAANGLSMSLNFALNFSVLPSASLRGVSTGVHVFTLGLNGTAALDLNIRDVDVNGTMTPAIALNVTKLSLDFEEFDSAVGPVNLAALQGIADILLPIVQSILNDVMGKGVALPSVFGMELVDPVVSYGEGYVLADTNISF